MKNQGSPTGARASNGGEIRSLPSSIAFSPIREGNTAAKNIVRDSFKEGLMAPDSEGSHSLPRSTASSPSSFRPVDSEVSAFDIDEPISRFADPFCGDFLTNPIGEAFSICTQMGLSGLASFTGGTSWMNAASPPSLNMSHLDVPSLESGRHRILVVDDEVLYRELIADILDDEYEILFAANGIEALEIAEIKVPDLILLDVIMPGIDGYEVHERLKRDHRTREIPVIFISGLGEVAAETKGLMLGAVDFITKPINREPVRARVKAQIMLKLAHEKLILLAETDGLTGLANRFQFDKMLAYECARHLRSEKELSLILLDIDHFKSFNDTYGHVRGDQCLREIALAMAKAISRTTDFVARYGGEEFAALLPETPLIGAVMLAERVRSCISDLKLPHQGSGTGYVTASLGVVSGRLLAGRSNMDVVRAADIELYAAKAGGRNQVNCREFDSSGLMH
jgi:diguanylate cyclase (GGDEF)-like protein